MSLTARIRSLARRDAITALGAALSAIWILLLGLFWLLAPGGDGGSGGVVRLVAVVGTVMPLLMIWLAVGLARSIAVLRAEADELHDRLDKLREYAATRGAPPPAPGADPNRGRPPSQPAPDPAQNAASRPAVAARAAPASQPPAPQLGRSGDLRQTSMRFDAPESVAVPNDTLIRALNFPDGPDDAEAITALRTALKDHDNSRVLRAAQDVITLLAGNDIYMDDLPPVIATPDIWRRFADGTRGTEIAPLGGIRDEAALEVASAMLRGDEIFRDTAHHFLRHFDILLTRILSDLDDDQIIMLADTRSARAFMLVGRATGIFG